MTTICISAQYYAGTEAQVELPEGKTWDDIESFYVKWDCFHVKLVGEPEWQERALNTAGGAEVVDYKRPTSVTVYPVLEDGEVDYSIELADS